MYFIGIDLAWSERNNSAAACIYAKDDTSELISTQECLGQNEEILNFISKIAGTNPALVTIDAPLIVPNQTGSRPCDREITRIFGRYHAGTFPANRAKFGGKVRGEEIVHLLRRQNFIHTPKVARQTQVRQVIEVYPHPATIILFHLPRILKYKRRKGRSIEERQKELNHLQEYIVRLDSAKPSLHLSPSSFKNPFSLSGNSLKTYEDLLDALLCAYIGYHAWYWGPQGYHVFGDTKTGYILIPKLIAFSGLPHPIFNLVSSPTDAESPGLPPPQKPKLEPNPDSPQPHPHRQTYYQSPSPNTD